MEHGPFIPFSDHHSLTNYIQEIWAGISILASDVNTKGEIWQRQVYVHGRFRCNYGTVDAN